MAKMRRIAGSGGGSPRAIETLEKWLFSCLSQSEPTARFCRVVACHLVRGNSRGEEAFYLGVPEKMKDSDQWCRETAMDIYTRLQAEASVLAGLQRYALYSFYTDDLDNHASRSLVALDGGSDVDSADPLLTEGPDKTGLTSQAMRHLEAIMKVHVSGQMTLLQGYQTQVTKLSGMLEKVLDQRASALEREQAVMLQTQEHELAAIQARAKGKAIEALGEKLGLFLPAVANKIAGQQLFPVQANAMAMMVKGLMTSIASDETKMKTIMSVLEPEQQIVFFQLMEEATKRTDDKGLPKGEANGVSESSGGAETPDEILAPSA